MKTVNDMTFGDVAYVGAGQIHSLSLWQGMKRLRNGAPISEQEAPGLVKIRKDRDGWKAVIPGGAQIAVMGAPDPGDDWYVSGEVFRVSSID